MFIKIDSRSLTNKIYIVHRKFLCYEKNNAPEFISFWTYLIFHKLNSHHCLSQKSWLSIRDDAEMAAIKRIRTEKLNHFPITWYYVGIDSIHYHVPIAESIDYLYH